MFTQKYGEITFMEGMTVTVKGNCSGTRPGIKYKLRKKEDEYGDTRLTTYDERGNRCHCAHNWIIVPTVNPIIKFICQNSK